MIIHAFTKRLKKYISPIIYLFVIICFVKFLKSLTLPDNQPVHEATTSSLHVFHHASVNEVTKKSWLLVHATNSRTCYTLAAAYHNWNILLYGVAEKSAIHSKCQFLSNQDLTELCIQLNFSICSTKSHEILRVVAASYLLQLKPDEIMVLYSAEENRELIKHSEEKQPNIHLHDVSMQKFFLPDLHFGCNSTTRTTLGSNSQISSTYSLCVADTSFMLVSPVIFSSARCFCDTSAPSVMLRSGQYSVFSLSGAVIPKEAFWTLGLLLFKDYASKEYLFLMLLTQKLLGITGHRVKLTPATIYHRFHKPTVDLVKVKRMIKLVDGWMCKNHLFMDCVNDFIKSSGFISGDNVQNIEMWFKSMLSANYTFPVIRTKIDNLICKQNIFYSPVDYANSLPPKSKRNEIKYPINHLDSIQNVYVNICLNATNKKTFSNLPISSPWIQYGDLLLVVVFNKPHYESIPYVHVMYQPFFPNILFCGPQLPDKHKFPYLFNNQGVFPHSFITYNDTAEGHPAGSFNYECTTQAIQMNYNVEGYLTIADDTLLWLHQLHTFSKSVVWFLPEKNIRIGELRSLRECRLGMCDFFAHWNWWQDYQQATLDALNHLKETQINSTLLTKCYSQLVRLNGAEFRANGAYSDIYYIPKRLASEFAELSEIFLHFKVFLEIAVPTILRCIESLENVEHLKGTANWDPKSRDYPWQYFQKKYLFGQVYYHPCKWSYLTRSHSMGLYKNFMCKKVLPYLHDPYERFELI